MAEIASGTSGGEGTAPAEQAEAAGTHQDLLIQPGIGVGRIRFGMTAEQVKAVLGEPSLIIGTRALQYSAGFAVVLGEDGKVASLVFGGYGDGSASMVRACQDRTTEGIGMGSTEKDVLRAYGEPSRRTEREPGATVMRYASLGAVFTLRDGQLVHMTFLHKRQ